MKRHLRRPQLTTVLTFVSWAAAIIIVIAGLGALVIYGQGERAQADGLQKVVDNLRTRLADKDDDLQALLDRYASLYDDCEQAESCESTATPPEVIEQVFPVAGPQGLPGRAPTTDEITDAIVQYCVLHEECRGPVGAAGAAGGAGSAGAPGATGSTGEQGPPGAQGEQGPVGPTGADGQPPLTWTYTDTLGFEHTCTRTDPFDAAAPTYTCT